MFADFTRWARICPYRWFLHRHLSLGITMQYRAFPSIPTYNNLKSFPPCKKSNSPNSSNCNSSSNSPSLSPSKSNRVTLPYPGMVVHLRGVLGVLLLLLELRIYLQFLRPWRRKRWALYAVVPNRITALRYLRLSTWNPPCLSIYKNLPVRHQPRGYLPCRWPTTERCLNSPLRRQLRASLAVICITLKRVCPVLGRRWEAKSTRWESTRQPMI